MTAISKVLTGMIEGRMVGYHLAAILAGYLLDLCLGDPHSMPHPVRAIGNLIVWLEKYLRPAGKKHATERGERRAGVLFVCLVLLVTGSVAGAILWISRLGGIWIQTVVEAVMTYYLLAARSLRDEHGGLPEAGGGRDRGSPLCSVDDCRARYETSFRGGDHTGGS